MSIQTVKLPVKLPAVPFGVLQQTSAGSFGAKMYIEYETLSGKVCEYMIKNYDGEKQFIV